MSSDRRNFQPPNEPLTAEQVHERVAWLKAKAREGADRVHAAGTPLEKRHQPTPAEELAKARARADRGTP